MRAHYSLGFLLVFALPLFAQQNRVNEHQLGAYKGDEDAVASVMNYCDAVEDSMREQQPRIFAEALVDSTNRSAGHRWREFANKDEWNAAGKPAPLAFVWDRDGVIVRVTIVARPPRAHSPLVTHGRIDYCYGTDTKLSRIRAIWSVPTQCEVLFPCRLISDHAFFLGGGGWPAITDWVFTADGAIQKLRNGKEADDYFDPSNSLTAGDLHLRTSQNLPFSKSISQPAPR